MKYLIENTYFPMDPPQLWQDFCKKYPNLFVPDTVIEASIQMAPILEPFCDKYKNAHYIQFVSVRETPCGLDVALLDDGIDQYYTFSSSPGKKFHVSIKSRKKNLYDDGFELRVGS